MCAGSEFQVDGAETEHAREAKLLVIPEGLAKMSSICNSNDALRFTGTCKHTDRQTDRQTETVHDSNGIDLMARIMR